MSLDQRIEYLEMKNRHKKRLRPWYKKTWGIIAIILGIIILSAAIAASIYISKQVKIYQQQNNAINETQETAKITAAIDGRGESFGLGPNDAKVQIVIFSDFACSYCQQAAPILRNLSKKYGDQVHFVFRNYPLHENSISLALAANCAGEQDKFWDMHDLLFDRQKQLNNFDDNTVKAPLKEIAAEMKLDTAKFDTCLDKQTYLYRLNDDFADAELLGLSGTPTWFINRYKVTGYYPEENFISVIDGLLAQ